MAGWTAGQIHTQGRPNMNSYKGDNYHKTLEVKLDQLESKNQRIAELSELAGQQEALTSVMHEINMRQTDTGRKTIDIETVQKIIINKLQTNTDKIDKLMKTKKDNDKVINIKEDRKSTRLNSSHVS